MIEDEKPAGIGVLLVREIDVSIFVSIQKIMIKLIIILSRNGKPYIYNYEYQLIRIVLALVI